MPVLKLWQTGVCREISFTGDPLLASLLVEYGYEKPHPCAGRGICGKCAVRAAGALSAPTEAEKRAGSRLSCQTRLLGDAEVWLPEEKSTVELSGGSAGLGRAMEGRIGAAVDLGTTTIALKLYDLKTGEELAAAGAMNPQRSIAADVMGRIGAAMGGLGAMLQSMAADTIRALLARTGESGADAMVVTGNTTMLYLLTGRDPGCLSAAPFLADCLFGRAGELLGMPVYYPPCMNAFVGADITCAVLASGMHTKQETALLMDIGTNGEIALWKDGTLHVTSTAAGPAFEGAGITHGCGSIPGAIDRVWVEDGAIRIHTIEEKEPVGICGSGIIDAVAAFLETEDIDETGAAEEDFLPLSGTIGLTPADIRAVQLAKGAMAAGVRTLLETAGVPEKEIGTLYIAGGFGSHLNVGSAAAIGLIPPALKENVVILGNAALSGAASLLLDRDLVPQAEALARTARHINLGGNSRFNEHFIDAMLFEVEYPDQEV